MKPYPLQTAALWGLCLALFLVQCDGTMPAPEDPDVEDPEVSEVPEVPLELTDTSIAFVNVQVVPMDSERILAGQTVLIEDGRIAALGPVAEVAIADGIPRIDGAGTTYLMPGLADMHIHMRGDATTMRNDLFLHLANGVTTVRDMSGTGRKVQLRDAFAAGTFLGPTVYVGSPIMDGPGGPFGPGIATPADARDLVRFYKNTGYDFIKVYTFLAPEVYAAILDEAAIQGLPVDGHVPNAVTVENALAAGQRSLEHMWGIAEEATSSGAPYSIFSDPMDLDRVRANVQRIKTAGAWSVPTFCANTLSTTLAADLRSRPAYRYVSPTLQNIFADPNAFQGHANATQSITNARLIIEALLAQEVDLLLGTDAGFAYMLPGFVIHDELRNLVAAGLRPYQAYRAGTADAARFLGAAADFGTVAVGRRADLVLLNADPLADVSHFEQRLGVMVKGHWFSERRLKDRLEEIATSYGQ